MFCLDPLHPIFNAVLDVVARNPEITMAELHKKVRAKKIDVTLQHLYRTVNRLVDEQILLKNKGKISINLMWLSFIEFFAQTAKKDLLDGREARIFPLMPNERRVFTVDSLLDVQTLWNHLLVQLYRTSPEKYLFKYYSHAWWQFGKHALDVDFYKTIKQKGVSCYWLYGNATPLDRSAAGNHRELFASRIATPPPFPAEGYNLNVYGEYILECIFPEAIAQHFALLFSSVASPETLEASLFENLFSLKGPYKVTVWRNSKQAAILRKKIEGVFLAPERV